MRVVGGRSRRRRQRVAAARVAAGVASAVAMACAPPGAPRPPGPGFAVAPEDSVTLEFLGLDPRLVGIRTWAPGAWATYEVGLRREGAPVRRVTFAVLDSAGGAFWVEVREEWAWPAAPRAAEPGERPRGRGAGPEETAGRGRRASEQAPLPPPVVRQWLLEPGPIVRARMREERILDPDGGIRRAEYERRPEASPDRLEFPAAWVWVAEEEVETPKGRLRAHHYRRSGTNVWVGDAVPPLGLVRAAGRGPLVRLVDWGAEGATSSIPARPAP